MVAGEFRVAPTTRIRDGASIWRLQRYAKYRPSASHWYLPIIGVDPMHQGKGYGGALLKCALEDCDREHLPALLGIYES